MGAIFCLVSQYTELLKILEQLKEKVEIKSKKIIMIYDK